MFNEKVERSAVGSGGCRTGGGISGHTRGSLSGLGDVGDNYEDEKEDKEEEGGEVLGKTPSSKRQRLSKKIKKNGMYSYFTSDVLL